MSALGTFLWIYDDRQRDIALIRGMNVKRILEAAGVQKVARYSVVGKGWVIPGAKVGDVCGTCEHTGTTYRVKAVTS